MKKTKSQSLRVLPNMQIYHRPDSQNYYGCLRINGRYFRKCLSTSNKNEAIKNLFDWKKELYQDPDLLTNKTEQSFSTYANRLIQKEKFLPPRPSGIEQWMDTKRVLYRKKGLMDFFGNRNIHDIDLIDIEDFFKQLPLNKNPLATSYLKKHLNLLKKVFISSGRTNIRYPTFRGRKSEPRGYFNKVEYDQVLKSAERLVGFCYTNPNGTSYKITKELAPFIEFMVGSMLRPTVSEIYSLKHNDIKEKKITNHEYLEFSIIRKNRKMLVQTLPASFHALKKIEEIKSSIGKDEYVFAPQYLNRRTAMRYLSNMFSQLLKELDMTRGQLGEPRSLYSLRHTALIFNLSKQNVDLFDIARRADTSIKMIQDYYYPQAQLDEKLLQFLNN